MRFPFYSKALVYYVLKTAAQRVSEAAGGVGAAVIRDTVSVVLQGAPKSVFQAAAL